MLKPDHAGGMHGSTMRWLPRNRNPKDRLEPSPIHPPRREARIQPGVARSPVKIHCSPWRFSK
jgi:hypothetical protein